MPLLIAKYLPTGNVCSCENREEAKQMKAMTINIFFMVGWFLWSLKIQKNKSPHLWTFIIKREINYA